MNKDSKGLYTPANYVITSKLGGEITNHCLYRKSGLIQPSASGVTDGVSTRAVYAGRHRNFLGGKIVIR